jgi:hypothetical protein
VTAIINLEPTDTNIWIPKLLKSQKTDHELRENEAKQYKIMFKLDNNQYNKRGKTYKINLTKAYA